MALELKTRDDINVNDIRTWPNNVAIIKKPEKREEDPLVEEEVIKAILQHYPQLGVFEAKGHLFLEIRKPPDREKPYPGILGVCMYYSTFAEGFKAGIRMKKVGKSIEKEI